MVLAILASACGQPGVVEEPVEEPASFEQEAVEEEEEQAAEGSVEEEPAGTGVDARFTIQEQADLHDALADLYASVFDGEEAVFLEEGAEVEIVEIDGPIVLAGEGMPAVFLPGYALSVNTENADAETFVDFALSADGQMVLFTHGLLPESITVQDQAGEDVEIHMPVWHVISAHGPTTFMFYAVGAGDRLVGASYLGARDPNGAAAMERIDPRSVGFTTDEYFSQDEFNIEEAIKLDPNLVAATVRTSWIDSVEELGVPVVRYEAETPDLLEEAMLMTGQIMGPYGEARAQAWVNYYDSVFHQVVQETSALDDEERVKVLFTGTDPLRVASGQMYQSAIIEAAGGVSATTELVGYWNDVNLEQVAIWDPDVILVPPYGGASVEAITESPEWQILDAVVDGRVYKVPKLVAPWDTPTPDSVLGVIWMAERLYPDLITLDCAAETEYYYNTFYDYDISEEEVQNLCSIE
jgi:iron complex transport system substrate-binding protein